MTEGTAQFVHERYEEFCALATAGMLTPEESEALSGHLEVCEECRQAAAQYASLARVGMPFLADNFAPISELTAHSSSALFDENAASVRLLQTVAAGRQKGPRVPARPVATAWNRHPAFRGAVAASVLAGIAFGSYRLGQRTPAEHTKAMRSPAVAILNPPGPPSPLVVEKQALEQTVHFDEQKLAVLEDQAASSSIEAAKLRAARKNAEDRLAEVTASLAASKTQADAQLAAITEERDASVARFHDAEDSYKTVQAELETLRNQHQQDLLRLASLDNQVGTLTATLNDEALRSKNDEQYLSSDKDIRDLIGARNLYIADIMDVDESGQSRKPFGRVFYTKTKSLIFYAYDLDHQPGVKRASTFQVWGRTGANDKKPINLGMLYLDSASNKRWTLRVDNPEQLAQLDAIFVTIEPHPQSDRPTGKPFLYASLRRDANHP